MNNIIKRITCFFKENIKLLLSLSLYMCTIFIYIKCFKNKYFTISNDAIYQYNLFYEEWIRTVTNFFKTGKLNTFSYNMFLGTDFYSAMGYYCVGDIFLPLLLIFRNNLRIGLIIEIILCVFISGLSMKAFLDKIKVKNKNIVLFISLIYAVAGHSVWMVQDYMFHRFYAFLPLLFYAVFHYFDTNKKTPFIIVVALLFLQSYYFMYPTLIFLLFFCLTELIKQKKNASYIVSRFFGLLFGVIIGFFISAIVCLPSFMYVLDIVGRRTPSNNLYSWQLSSKIGIILSYLSINPIRGFSSIFGTSFDYNEVCYNIFVTIIPFVFCIRYLIKKVNRTELILMCILQLICFVKPLNSIMHGFSTPSLRWIFLIEFYILYLAAKSLSEYNDVKERKNILIIGVIILSVCIALFAVLLLNNNISTYIEHIWFIVGSLLFEIMILIVFIFKNNISYFLTILFALLSTIFYFSHLISDNPYYLRTIDLDELNTLQNDDDLFYRYFYSYKDSFDGLPSDMNSSVVNRIPSTSSYNTMYETKIDKFIDLSNSRLTLDWMLEVSDLDALNMLGVKYYISKDDKLDSSNLEYIGELRNYSPPSLFLYKNKLYSGFGYTKNKLKYTDNFSNSSDFANYLMIDDKDIDLNQYSNITSNSFIINNIDNNQIEGEISLDTNNILFIPFPNNKGWKIKVNDSAVKPISVNGGFIGLKLNKGYNNIVMEFHTPYLLMGTIISALGLITTIIIGRKERKI